MNKLSNTITVVTIAAILAGTSMAHAQDQTETAPQQNPMMSNEGMQQMPGMQGGGMMGMMRMKSEMMETCNRMMQAMALQNGVPEMKPQQDNG